MFLTVYEFFFVFEIHHIPYHRYPLQKSFMALFFMDGRQDVVSSLLSTLTLLNCAFLFSFVDILSFGKKKSINFVTI